MLTLPVRLPVKRMAIYGSSALLVGFASTLVLLREFVPKDGSEGLSYVQPVIPATSTTETQGAATSDVSDKSAASATPLPGQSQLVIQGGALTAPRYAQISPVTSSTAPQANLSADTSSHTPVPSDSSPAEQPAPVTATPILSPVQETLDTALITNQVSIDSVQ